MKKHDPARIDRRMAFTALLMAALCWGCAREGSNLIQPKPLDGMEEVATSGESDKLDDEVQAFLRDQFTIQSARYYRVPGEIPWIAVSSSVQNQMAERSIRRSLFEWYEPGIDFVEVYPQGDEGDAFAVAMPSEGDPGAEKLVGFYVLTTTAQ